MKVIKKVIAGKEALELRTSSGELAGWIDNRDGLFAFIPCPDARYLPGALVKISRILTRLNNNPSHIVA